MTEQPKLNAEKTAAMMTVMATIRMTPTARRTPSWEFSASIITT